MSDLNEPNKCLGCKISTNRDYKFCLSCYNNPDIIIYRNQAKKIYGLTDEELDSSNIYSEKFYYMHQDCEKYLKKDIHELARKLIKNENKNKNDTRQDKFDKIDTIIKEREKELKEKKKTTQQIIKNVNILLGKTPEYKILNINYNSYLMELISDSIDNLMSTDDIIYLVFTEYIEEAKIQKIKWNTEKQIEELEKKYQVEKDYNMEHMVTTFFDEFGRKNKLNSTSFLIKYERHIKEKIKKINHFSKMYDEKVNLPPKEKQREKEKILKKMRANNCIDYEKEINELNRRREIKVKARNKKK